MSFLRSRSGWQTIRIGTFFFGFVLWQVGMVAGTPLQELEFNRDIRPILAENCFYCHGQDANQRQADLRLDQPQSALASGAIVPGDMEASLLIQRVLELDEELVMPPVHSNRHLSDKQKQKLKDWVAQGAEYQTHWAFENPVRPEVPSLAGDQWCRNDIDRFIMSKWNGVGLEPSPEADRATLIKRLYIDLIGLPPTPEEVTAFVSDPAEDAYTHLVEKLLASPHYGERMALPWLDAARYADSNGFQQDGDHWQWMWRDWLVQALNNDMPFDQFTIWQLAGDLLPGATVEQKIASGFNRNHMLNGEGGAIAEEQRWVNLFDRVDTTATTWLGLTVACGQCHDHKYDPITQVEYYQFLDAFNRVPETGVPQYISSRIRVGEPYLELPTEENNRHIAELESKIEEQQKIVDHAAAQAFQGWLAGLDPENPDSVNSKAFTNAEETLKAVLAKPLDQRSNEDRAALPNLLKRHFDTQVLPSLDQLAGVAEQKRLREELNSYRADFIPRVMIMSDDRPRETHRLDRGQYLSPLEKVEFGTPAFLPAMDPQWSRNRLGLAQWLVSDQHPLTARVQVNRMWQHFFGRGLVKTSEDFGVQSQFPTHLKLLDWLAVEFRENGWKVKDMHRLILNSSTYRQSSRIQQEAYDLDPENQWYSRAARFRMPAMLLRDWALSSSQLLNRKMGGAPVYPYQPDQVWESLAITKERDFTYPQSTGPDLYRRSLYTFWRRTVGPANMFDSSNRQTCRVRSPETSTPLHALTTLNDRTWVEAARELARIVWPINSDLSDAQRVDAAIGSAFERVICRPISPTERQRLHNSFDRWRERYISDSAAARQLLSIGEIKTETEIPEADHAALAVVCLTIFNLDEALTRE